jgi:hypothetical protein
MFGVFLAVLSGAVAFSVWLTVRSHPEVDLPFWPAWIFACASCVGIALTVMTFARPGSGRPKT